MPELPEVETIKLQLKKYLIGHKIEKVEIRYGKKFEGDPKDIEDAKIKDVRRFGKALSIDLDNGYSLLIHIKMTGQLIYAGPNLKKIHNISKKILGGLGGKHTHIIFHLDNEGILYYNDVRKFGWIHIYKTAEIGDHKFIGKLGLEPKVGKGEIGKVYLDVDGFKKMLSKSGRAVKLIIMDQEKIGGVGNIYANDALWLSQIDPRKAANELTDNEAEKLFQAIRKVLEDGLKHKGASEQSYITPDGSEGEYQNHTLVYGHEGELCKNCGKVKIEKFFISGRGTYWCPRCQN